MQINWFTVIAEIINFLVLIWLLKRFLYKPILQAIDEREKKITEQLADAQTKKTDAQKEQDEFRKKNVDFDQQKSGLMAKVVLECNTTRDQMLEKARNEATALGNKLENVLKENQENKDRDLAKKTQDSILAITKKALTDIASESLEEQSVNIFIKRLTASSEEEKKQFSEAFRHNGNTMQVQSAFEMPANKRTDINNIVNEMLGTKAPLQFTASPELISGIEISNNGFKLGWSISDFLKSIEKNISENSPENSAEVSEKK